MTITVLEMFRLGGRKVDVKMSQDGTPRHLVVALDEDRSMDLLEGDLDWAIVNGFEIRHLVSRVASFAEGADIAFPFELSH